MGGSGYGMHGVAEQEGEEPTEQQSQGTGAAWETPATPRGKKRCHDGGGSLRELPAATRSKARELLQRSVQELPAEAEKAEGAATALERAVFATAPDATEYRVKIRALAAALRRNETARARAFQGEAGARQLAEDGGEEHLLTDGQREQRAKVRQQSLERCLGTSLGHLGYYLMGIDCNGADCHVECERRHLEVREQARGSWQPLEKSRLIICAGPERSGSTWLYNAVRLLHLHAKVPCDSYWIARLTEDKLRERLDARPAAVVCIKTHEWFPEYEGFVRCAAHIVLTHRDLRSVCASYRRVKWAVAIPDAYVAEHLQWRQRCTLDLAFEDLVRSGEASLRRLAEHLQLRIDGSGVSSVHRELLELRRSHTGNAVCQITKLWPDHVSNSTRLLQDRAEAQVKDFNVLKDPEYAQVLNTRFREYQETYGYIPAQAGAGPA